MTHGQLSLSEYIRVSGRSPDEIAVQAGVNRSSITRYLSGTRVPRMSGGDNSEMARLIRACEGMISADSFLQAVKSREVA